MYMQVLADKAAVHVDIARAEAVLGGARAFLYETVEDMWETVRGADAQHEGQLALGRAASTHAVDTAAAVTRTVSTLEGGSDFYDSSSLQRYARDAEAMTHHFTVPPNSLEGARACCSDASRLRTSSSVAAAVCNVEERRVRATPESNQGERSAAPVRLYVRQSGTVRGRNRRPDAKGRRAMRWESRRRSENVEDRRGMRAAGPVGVGGIGTIAVVLLVSWLTTCTPSAPAVGQFRFV